MTYATFTDTVNPFYSARNAVEPAVYAKLPQAPRNTSPVPHLTSLYHDDNAGNYGDRSYPGNCGGNLIRDLLNFFQPKRVFDPMSGSGTCRDVCRELRIDCWSADIHQGIDLCEPTNFFGSTARFEPRTFDFVWIHPPYWRQKLYAADSRDLSRAATLEDFLERYQQAIVHCSRVLKPGGHLAVLMGDYVDRESGFVPLTWHTKDLAFKCGLKQACTDIVRFSHGASSSRKVYRSSFIPGLHDICAVFTKPEGKS
ncbi:MAG: hypothetical protein KDA96_22425 [Planctomycetaceae bacterium]|nr:hypothetical protein [Planctomycetaceae bacterium]